MATHYFSFEDSHFKKLRTGPFDGAGSARQVLSATDPVRAGQALFVTQCLPCHKFNGAGDGTLGPDLDLSLTSMRITGAVPASSAASRALSVNYLRITSGH